MVGLMAPGVQVALRHLLLEFHQLCPSFQPIFLVDTGKTLDKGFPYTYSPSKSNLRTFVSHGINEKDWIRYVFVSLGFRNSSTNRKK